MIVKEIDYGDVMDYASAADALPLGASAPPPASNLKSMYRTTRPVMRLLGGPVIFLNLYSGKWSDPGAYATDAVTCPVPVVVVSAPAANFTNATTDPLKPLVVEYIAESAISGLTSILTWSLRVVDACSAGGSEEFTCVEGLKCSVNGVCGAAAIALSDLFASLSEDSAHGGALVSWWNGVGIRGDDARAMEVLGTAVPEWIPPDTAPPTLTLLAGNYLTKAFVTAKGTAGVMTTVGVGEAYVDPGAVASKVPVNNPGQARALGVSAPKSYEAVGLMYCSININVPGVYKVAGAIAAVGGGRSAANAMQGSPVLVLLPAASANLTTAALLGEPPANQTVFVVYGTPAPVSLLPCTSVGAVGSCAAAAVQLSTNGSLVDLSPSVSATDVTPVDDGTDDGASAATALGRCSAATLSLGTCLPGVYVLQYSVLGASQPAHLSIVVEQLAATEFFLSTFKSSDGSSLSAATTFSMQLLSNATLLLATAMEHMPLFGISASAVRGVALNSIKGVARDTDAGTVVYDIFVELTLTTASTATMAVTIVPLVDTFDLYDAAAKAAYTQMYNDVSWASRNVSAQLEVVDDLLSHTLVAQAAFNSELSVTGALMASTLTLLQQQLTRTVVDAQLVLQGLGILNDDTLIDFQECMFNASGGRRFVFEVKTTTATSHRSLLLTASGTPSGDPYVFQGCGVFSDAASYQYNLYDTWNVDPARFLGSGYHNRVLSGLLLHTVRRPVASVTEAVRTSAHASPNGMEQRPRVCRSTAYPRLATACRDEAVSTIVAYLDGGGIRSDPVFNQLSSLYNTQVSMSDFYNMSDGSPEVNSVTGVPFGFCHTPLKRFDDGYPMLFGAHVSQKCIVELVHYVQDGGMLSSQLTDRMTLQMVTYNPEAVVFGYFSATFRWIDAGVISMTSKLMALPAVEYSHVVSSWQLKRSPGPSGYHRAPSSPPALAHYVSTADTDRALEAEIAEAALENEDAVRKDHGHSAPALYRANKYGATMSPFWIVFEAALCCLMVACIALWLSTRHSYVLYYFLQGFVLLGLIVRLIMYRSFQRRLSIVGGTLAALELFHFMLVVTTLFCMMAVFLNVVFGCRVPAASTFAEALFTLFKMLVFGDDTELYHALTIPGLDAPLERSMASAFRGVASVLVVWVLHMYLASFIILIYAGLNQYAKHMPGVPQDLRCLFKWWARKVRHKAPSNALIDKMLDKDQ
ncbi:hypothetical protein FOA52_007831 [Chlamydomonas sp. UWO 241]|nr:hypothetical protein FOA52_007831 [Chlamydomonas sp. UWO 241]